MEPEDSKREPLLSLAGKVKLGFNPDASSYERMPVADFGKMMLKKMGWHEDEGVGKNQKNALLHPIEFVPRHHRLGLGATPLPNMKINGEAGKLPKEEGVKQKEKSVLQTHNYKYVDEKLAAKANLEVGTEVLINKGTHEGMYGRIVGLYRNEDVQKAGGKEEDSIQLYIELLANDQVVKVDKSKVTISKGKNNKDKPNPEPKPKERSRSPSAHSSSHHTKNKKKKKLRWVVAGIIVRIVSKTYAAGKYYNKKVRVEDVPDRRSFTVVTPDKTVLEDLRESDVETVIPAPTEEVMLVGGSHKGEIGKLLMRDKKKDVVKVQLYDKDGTTISCSQDDCCATAEDKQRYQSC